MYSRPLLLVCFGFLLVASAHGGPPATQPAQARIGTYDPRAIACAYAPSELMVKRMSDLKAQYQDAETAGDKKKMAELKEQGAKMQHTLHMQGFGGAPVEDILALVKDQLPNVAQQAQVSVIVARPDYVAKDAPVVDVTDELVKLFKPSEKTLKTIAEVRKHPPVPMEQLDRAEKAGNL